MPRNLGNASPLSRGDTSPFFDKMSTSARAKPAGASKEQGDSRTSTPGLGGRPNDQLSSLIVRLPSGLGVVLHDVLDRIPQFTDSDARKEIEVVEELEARVAAFLQDERREMNKRVAAFRAAQQQEFHYLENSAMEAEAAMRNHIKDLIANRDDTSRSVSTLGDVEAQPSTEIEEPVSTGYSDGDDWLFPHALEFEGIMDDTVRSSAPTVSPIAAKSTPKVTEKMSSKALFMGTTTIIEERGDESEGESDFRMPVSSSPGWSNEPRTRASHRSDARLSVSPLLSGDGGGGHDVSDDDESEIVSGRYHRSSSLGGDSETKEEESSGDVAASYGEPSRPKTGAEIRASWIRPRDASLPPPPPRVAIGSMPVPIPSGLSRRSESLSGDSESRSVRALSTTDDLADAIAIRGYTSVIDELDGGLGLFGDDTSRNPDEAAATAAQAAAAAGAATAPSRNHFFSRTTHADVVAGSLLDRSVLDLHLPPGSFN